MNPGSRRLAAALAMSLMLHLLAIIPLRLPADSPADTLQIHLQASVSRTPPAAAQPPKARPPRTPQPATPPARQLTVPHGINSAAPNTPAAPPVADERNAEPIDALVIEQAQLPEYPADALARNLEGCVLASIQVGTSGEVESVSILASDHPGVFDASVIESQKMARYAPARQGGEIMPSRVLSVASFVLQPGKQLDCPLKFAAQAEKLVGRTAP